MALVKQAAAQSAFATNFTLTATFAASAVASAGNLLVATINESGTNPQLTDYATPTGWSVANTGTDTGGPQAGKMFWKEAAGGETGIAVVRTGTNNVLADLVVAEFSGLPAPVVDVAPTFNDPFGSHTTTQVGPSGTLASATEVMIVMVGDHNNGGTGSWDSGFTALTNANPSSTVLHMGYLETAATTSLSPICFHPLGQTWGCIASFRSNAVLASPTDVQEVLTVQSPAISLGASTVPTAVPETLVVQAPAINFGGSTTPTDVQQFLVVQPPTISIPGGTTATSVDSTLLVPAPSIVIGTSTFPTDVQSVLVVQAPTLRFDANLTMSAPVDAPFSIPAPTIALSQTATPATVGLTLLVPTPTPQSLTTGFVILNGAFYDQDGNPSTGIVRFAMPTSLLNTTTNVRYPPMSTEVTLDTAGTFTIQLRATDDTAFTPLPRQWVVTEFIDGVSRTYAISLLSLPLFQYLADLTPLT